ncbi:MAG: glycogen/starch synthase [Deltaproteobacteria bacterium]|nr:glycogen/starch synthase [Deltaproteobacteria bacterium]
MPEVIFYFQFHQPRRLHPDRDKFLWHEKNQEAFVEAAETCYEPALDMLAELLTVHRGFKIAIGLSGTFLEQAEAYRPGLVTLLQRLMDIDSRSNRVECLDEPYYYSLAGLFRDPQKQEFRDQVSLHRDKLRQLFGRKPLTFHDTELLFDNDTAAAAADMGYRVMLCESRDTGNAAKEAKEKGPCRAKGSSLLVISRHRELSDRIAVAFADAPVSPDEYASMLGVAERSIVLLGFDIGHLGRQMSVKSGIFEFWRNLPAALEKNPAITVATPEEAAALYGEKALQEIDIPAGFVPAALMSTQTQRELLEDIERVENRVKQIGGELLTQWRYFTTADHAMLLGDGGESSGRLIAVKYDYDNSSIRAAHVITRKIDYFEMALSRFEILKRSRRTAVLLISPETGRLPDEMGPMARYISGKSGGLGEVVSALCEGLLERNIDVHLSTLNLKKRFQQESRIDEDAWREMRYKVDSDKIHLVSSSVFASLTGAYAGDPRLNAAEFQKEVVNNILKTVMAKSRGKLLVHSHDWMAGGAVTAYCRSRGIPVLHTVHNSFTGHIPLDMVFGIDVNDLASLLYFSDDSGKKCIDCQATAIKNATLINFVGNRFLEEVVNDFFLDRHFIPSSVRQEVKAKYAYGSALAIINAPSRLMYPETCEQLALNFGPDDDVIAAKRENLVEFQQRTGLTVDREAILFFWPSRLDPVQKGVELLEEIMLRFVQANNDVQFAVLSDGVGADRVHEQIIGRIAWASGGKIAYHHFNEELAMLGFAAACDVFGASLYEPCGQIDQVGNLFGATATNRDTGGYHDKIRELRLKALGAPQDVGNGFLFRDYDSRGLWYGLEKSLRFHRLPREMREQQLKRIMRESRHNYDLDTMIAEYVRVYERLNGGKPLS